MPVVDAVAVCTQLCRDDKVAARLAADYGLSGEWRQPHTLPRTLNAAFAQQPVDDPLEAEWSNVSVFRAAVRALASNSRSWSKFMTFEQRLEEHLRHCDPTAVVQALARGELTEAHIRTCLPGQSGGQDARAILRWAALLCDTPDYYRALREVGRALRRRDLDQAEVVPCVAVLMGDPPSDRRWQSLFADVPRPPTLASWKLPGMGAILASEFLRNLGWSGFKPDRHVKRLFDRWFPDVLATCQPRALELAQLCGRNTKDAKDFLAYSLAGIAVTPPGRTLSEIDNVVWALGAYVEKKGRESSTRYRMD